jgi:hypothetical protein
MHGHPNIKLLATSKADEMRSTHSTYAGCGVWLPVKILEGMQPEGKVILGRTRRGQHKKE